MRTSTTKAALVVAALVVASLACNALSSLPLGGGSTGDSLLKDDFSDSQSGWGTGTDADSSVEYDRGGLRMKISRPEYFTWSTPDAETYQNVHMETTVRNEASDVWSGFGLMCDQQANDTSFYYFVVTPDGEYAIVRSESGKDDVFLTNNDDWGSSDLIVPNAPSYRIGADCGPGRLTLYVDGKKIDTAADSSYDGGGVGVFLWSGSDGASEVVYDDFALTQLK